jgi:hypothetical protein
MAIIDQIIGAESGGNPMARNPRSPALREAQVLIEQWRSGQIEHWPMNAGF